VGRNLGCDPNDVRPPAQIAGKEPPALGRPEGRRERLHLFLSPEDNGGLNRELRDEELSDRVDEADGSGGADRQPAPRRSGCQVSPGGGADGSDALLAFPFVGLATLSLPCARVDPRRCAERDQGSSRAGKEPCPERRPVHAQTVTAIAAPQLTEAGDSSKATSLRSPHGPNGHRLDHGYNGCRYARRCGHRWCVREEGSALDEGTGRPAKAQVRTAEDALAVARSDAEVAKALADHQLDQSVRAARRAAEERVDALMPTVLARATPGLSTGEHAPFLEVAWPPQPTGKPYPDWQPVTGALELSDDQAATFRINATIYLTNHSKQVAQVDVIDPGNATVSLPSGQSLVLRPKETRPIAWQRVLSIGALRSEEGVNRPEVCLFNPRLWIRDLGLNAYDEVVFSAGLPFFRRNGSRLIVTPAVTWTESIGQLMPDRAYDRLDAAADRADQT